ncbi:MAG TPA: DUF3054 domain-containing protein [Mycobacterium sp.]|nr:DUF3054 domain-containing protein [Mycobacterium sp.]
MHSQDSDTTPPPATSPAARQVATAAVIDVVCVVLFCAIGRRSHAEGLTLTGVAETAWPFLAGTAVGWLLSRLWPGGPHGPAAVYPAGVTIWLATVVIGMLLRALTGQGVAFSFIVVASIVTALLLLGWRAVWALVSRMG